MPMQSSEPPWGKCVDQLIKCALFLVLVSFSPIGAYGHDNHGAVSEDGRFTPNEAGAIWPPQLREITQVRQYQPVPGDSQARRTSDLSLQSVESDSSVAEALGERFRLLSSVQRQDKSGRDAWQRLLYYSYSLDQTVAVIVRGERPQRVDSVTVTPASIDQPPLSEQEMAEAIALARAYWRSEGASEVEALTAYAIQTFQSDGTPFPSRMSYVSFHIESPEAPLYANNVDLSTNTVERSGVEQ